MDFSFLFTGIEVSRSALHFDARKSGKRNIGMYAHCEVNTPRGAPGLLRAGVSRTTKRAALP
eukprot:2452852-Alexandrium_andersonii.AAC.1